MKRDTLLVVGARGQLGSELTPALRKMYGALRVVAADLGSAKEGSLTEGSVQLNLTPGKIKQLHSQTYF